MTTALTPTKQMDLVISDAQHQILTQQTPREEIRLRKGRGNRQFPYTDPAYVIRTLNLAFGWDWDFEADHEEILYVKDRPFEARCRGKLTVRSGDKIFVKVQFGSQPIDFLQNDHDTPVSLGDAFKGAASDALKKCASLLGIALDLYDSDSDINTGKQTPSQPQQAKNVVVEQPKAGNGGSKVSSDPMTIFWSTVRSMDLTQQQGRDILAKADGNASRAVDILIGMSQEQTA